MWLCMAIPPLRRTGHRRHAALAELEAVTETVSSHQPITGGAVMQTIEVGEHTQVGKSAEFHHEKRSIAYEASGPGWTEPDGKTFRSYY